MLLVSRNTTVKRVSDSRGYSLDIKHNFVDKNCKYSFLYIHVPISLYRYFFKECEAGKYSKFCSEGCGAYVDPTVCNHITGICELVCKPGWKKKQHSEKQVNKVITRILVKSYISYTIENNENLRLGCVWFQFHLIMFIFNISLQQWDIWTQLPVQV